MVLWNSIHFQKFVTIYKVWTQYHLLFPQNVPNRPEIRIYFLDKKYCFYSRNLILSCIDFTGMHKKSCMHFIFSVTFTSLQNLRTFTKVCRIRINVSWMHILYDYQYFESIAIYCFLKLSQIWKKFGVFFIKRLKRLMVNLGFRPLILLRAITGLNVVILIYYHLL